MHFRQVACLSDEISVVGKIVFLNRRGHFCEEIKESRTIEELSLSCHDTRVYKMFQTHETRCSLRKCRII